MPPPTITIFMACIIINTKRRIVMKRLLAFLCSPCRRGLRPGVAVQARAHRRRLPAWRHRRDGAPARRQAAAGVGPARRGGEQARREHHHRRRRRRQERARRAHHPHDHGRHLLDQPAPVQQAALRCTTRLHSGDHAGAAAPVPGRAPVAAREQPAGIDRLGEGKAGNDQLCVLRQRQPAASCRRDAQAQGRHRSGARAVQGDLARGAGGRGRGGAVTSAGIATWRRNWRAASRRSRSAGRAVRRSFPTCRHSPARLPPGGRDARLVRTSSFRRDRRAKP